MGSAFLLVLAVCGAVSLAVRSADTSTLRLVQVLYRHGARAPSRAYPSDSYQEDFWLQGFKQMTPFGMQQTYNLGRYLQSRYEGFLNSTYLRKEVTVQSTDKDRTLQSAYCVLTGLYPPAGQQVWSADIAWQPIPVHTAPAEDDWILYIDECPKNDQMEDDYVATDPGYKQVEADNQDLINYVTNRTGAKPTLDGLFKYINTFNLENIHNLTLPDWIYVNDTFDRYMTLMDYKSSIEYIVPEMARLKAGPLLGHMIQMMRKKIEDSAMTEKMLQYSAHSGNLNAFLRVTRTHNDRKPPLSSCIMVELHEDLPAQYSVRMFYRNVTTTNDAYELRIQGCTMPCPLGTFYDLMKDRIPADPRAECQLKQAAQTPCEPAKDGRPDGADETTLIAIVAVLASLLLIVSLVLVLTCIRKKRDSNIHKISG